MAERQEYDVIVLGGGSTGENAAWYAPDVGLCAQRISDWGRGLRR